MSEPCAGGCGEVLESEYEVFVVNGDYFCSKDCVHKQYTEDEYQALYKADEAYFTTME